MILASLRWLGRNLSTLLLAFLLAVVVWVSAVMNVDPNQELVYSRPVDIKIIGQDPSLLIVDKIPTQVRLTLNAPRTIWDQLNNNPDLVSAWIDLSGLGKGEHTVEVKAQVAINPVQIVKKEPSEIKLTLEPSLSKTLQVNLVVTGEPAQGYRKGDTVITPSQVTVSGQESLVQKVTEVRGTLDITGKSESIKTDVNLQAYDVNGDAVSGVVITPSSVTVTQPINLLGGYRNVAVKVITTGQVASGYWVTNISVTPPNVTVFSKNPQLVNSLPGFVETNPIDLTGLSDDTDVRATLNLPDGVTLAGEESVLVRLGIAAREGSLPISLSVEVIGLPPELEAKLSPDTVDILISGPLPILNNLKPSVIRVSVNVAGLEVGTHQVTPVVDLLPSQIKVASILPETVEVTISPAATATPTAEGTQSPAAETTQTVTGSATPTPESGPVGPQTPTPTP